jgi:flagellar hook-associated protein 1 FlgK
MTTTSIDWEAEIVELLGELTSVQDELFQSLAAKRDCLARRDFEALSELDEREEEVRGRLEACHQRRERLLSAARQRRLPSESLGGLASSAAIPGREKLAGRVKETSHRMRLLQHECLTNWVVAQRSLLHYAQMLRFSPPAAAPIRHIRISNRARPPRPADCWSIRKRKAASELGNSSLAVTCSTRSSMSLFGSLQIGKNALSAAQIGLQVTGNNIANAATPDYIRQDVELRTAPSQRIGGLNLGLGVELYAVYQRIDKHLEERLRGATSDLASGEAQEKAFVQLEALIGELGESDLSTSFSRFFGAVHDVVNQPESPSVRNLAVLEGVNLASDIRRLDQQVRTTRADVNEQVYAKVDTVNSLTREIADLNVKIVTAEGGGAVPSDAVGLRDRRQRALTLLSEIIDIRAVEQESGAVNVFAGGDFLVFDHLSRDVIAETGSDRGLRIFELRLEEIDAPLVTSGGELGGLLAARDQVLGGFLDRLTEFTGAFIQEFNRVHAGGQGLTGYASLTSEHAVDDATVPLDQAGLAFTPDNGAFEVLIRDRRTSLTQTTVIQVPLNGLDDDLTFNELVQRLDAVDGLSASVDSQGKLALAAENGDLEFAFAGDTSGVLAALGINNFFTGTTSNDIGVSRTVQRDPRFFAASQGGIGADANIAEALAVLMNTQLDSLSGGTLTGQYEEMVAGVTQNAAAQRATAEGLRVFKNTLEGQKLATSGVNLDEEAVKMIAFQRSFQASARFISTVNELLEILVNL